MFITFVKSEFKLRHIKQLCQGLTGQFWDPFPSFSGGREGEGKVELVGGEGGVGGRGEGGRIGIVNEIHHLYSWTEITVWYGEFYKKLKFVNLPTRRTVGTVN